MEVEKVNASEFDGKVLMRNSSVSICSIVRDCGRNLERNIPRVEYLRKFFKSSEVIVFENDSKDNTLKLLLKWEKDSTNVNVFTEKFKEETIPFSSPGDANPYFSRHRIEKMTKYRNKYLEYINNNGFERDFVIVIDLDISGFRIDGLVNSFGFFPGWDCISANGISLSSKLSWQYHDSYALIEHQRIDETQTEDSIRAYRSKYSFLKRGMPLIKVDSAFGGIAIYRWSSIKGIYYSCLNNSDTRVQCKSEHVGLHKAMIQNGYSAICINPSMMVKYRSLSISFLIGKIAERLRNRAG